MAMIGNSPAEFAACRSRVAFGLTNYMATADGK
jgi:hypothetical protein